MAAYLTFLIFLVSVVTFLPVGGDGGLQHQTLRRQKREWLLAPPRLREGKDYTTLPYIAKIRSDEETRTTIRYSLSGVGANQDPVNLFTVNSVNGYVRIHGILDREERDVYELLGIARFLNGSRAEKDAVLRVIVEDINDCPPVFAIQSPGEVVELSAAGTFVMRIIATDADKPYTPESQIAYSIQEGSAGASMFYVNKETGHVFVRQNTLDRETLDTYTLRVIGSDMNGQKGGNTGTGQVTIKLLDVNDNIPTLEKNFYEGSVEENTMNLEVMRIKALDADLMYSDNWLAVFSIVSGNEAGYFSITTDAKTNEGILMLNKAIDYEELKELNLQVSVSNKAAYHSSVVVTEGKSYPIKISVKNQPEGPRFEPAVKVITISESQTQINFQKVIATYAAMDIDTKLIATNVRYAKAVDIDNWLIIDEKTAEIRLNKFPDRESKYLKNGTYYAQIISITNDHPAKTATGTIAIQVEDSNDHCPTLTSTAETICYGDKVVIVTAKDEDSFPNSIPFTFVVTSKEKWTVEPLNDTSVILRAEDALWPGFHVVSVTARDQQGKACDEEQQLQVHVCTCDTSKTCIPLGLTDSKAELGVAAILLLLLGLLLLLLLPLLLLFCLCGSVASIADFRAIPFDTKEQLIPYNSEGQGDVCEIPLLQVPKDFDRGSVKAVDAGIVGGDFVDGGAVEGEIGGAAQGGMSSSMFYEFDQHYGHHQPVERYEADYVSGGMGQFNQSRYEGLSVFEGLALSDAFLGNYYSQKACNLADQEVQKDTVLVYGKEGSETHVDLDDCLNLVQEDNDLSFLDDLGPKFKALAEICKSSVFLETHETRESTLTAPPPPPSMTNVGIRTEEVVTDGLVSMATGSSTSSTTVLAETNRQATTEIKSTAMHMSVPSQTILIQQPAMYYAAPPVYMVDPRPHHTLLVPTSVLGVRDNLVLVEAGGSEAILTAQHGSPLTGVRQGQSLVLLESTAGGGAVSKATLGISQGSLVTSVSVSQSALGISQGSLVGGEAVSQATVGISQGSLVGGEAVSESALGISQGNLVGGEAVSQATVGISQGSLVTSGPVSESALGISQGSLVEGEAVSQATVGISQGSLVGGEAVSESALGISQGSLVEGEAVSQATVGISQGSLVTSGAVSESALGISQASLVEGEAVSQATVGISQGSLVGGEAVSESALGISQGSMVEGEAVSQATVGISQDSLVGGEAVSESALGISQGSMVEGEAVSQATVGISQDSLVGGEAVSESALAISQGSLVEGEAVSQATVGISQGSLVGGEAVSESALGISQGSLVGGEAVSESALGISQGSLVEGEAVSQATVGISQGSLVGGEAVSESALGISQGSLVEGEAVSQATVGISQGSLVGGEAVSESALGISQGSLVGGEAVSESALGISQGSLVEGEAVSQATVGISQDSRLGSTSVHIVQTATIQTEELSGGSLQTTLPSGSASVELKEQSAEVRREASPLGSMEVLATSESSSPQVTIPQGRKMVVEEKILITETHIQSSTVA